ncbi:hypothetical protein RFI_36217 [Reticulomyxa filosa]|uniref:Uncharacterized protein n=1 Tax=Reticulomyxa filosa TaxID=46433 RepID=X6LGV8_RETFI|nr:hypothetical protein RFI_36217 [Reticulomyxa filosa]|eukprot:ETO01223.1 hypothetical protein RFI_36217 [Reticulomyxa filosa]
MIENNGLKSNPHGKIKKRVCTFVCIFVFIIKNMTLFVLINRHAPINEKMYLFAPPPFLYTKMFCLMHCIMLKKKIGIGVEIMARFRSTKVLFSFVFFCLKNKNIICCFTDVQDSMQRKNIGKIIIEGWDNKFGKIMKKIIRKKGGKEWKKWGKEYEKEWEK